MADMTNWRICEPHLDWASMTLQETPERIVSGIRRKVEGAYRLEATKPQNKGYRRALKVVDVYGSELCTVESEASHGWNLVTATGTQPNEAVRDAVRWLASQGAMARATRLDSAIDIFGGDFDQLAGLVKNAAQTPENGSPVKSFEYWNSDSGRTFYAGSRAGSVRVRVYEKGKEQRKKGNLDAPLDWLRCELEWRPKKEQRVTALDFDNSQIWGASYWTSEVARTLLGGEVEHCEGAHELTKFESSYEWLCKSASGVFAEAVKRFGIRAVVQDLTGQALEDLPQLPRF